MKERKKKYVDVHDDDEIKENFSNNCNFMRFFIVFDLRALPITAFSMCDVQKCKGEEKKRL